MNVYKHCCVTQFEENVNYDVVRKLMENRRRNSNRAIVDTVGLSFASRRDTGSAWRDTRVASRVGRNASRFRHVMPRRCLASTRRGSARRDVSLPVTEETRASRLVARSRRRACRSRARVAYSISVREASLSPSVSGNGAIVY